MRALVIATFRLPPAMDKADPTALDGAEWLRQVEQAPGESRVGHVPALETRQRY